MFLRANVAMTTRKKPRRFCLLTQQLFVHVVNECTLNSFLFDLKNFTEYGY